MLDAANNANSKPSKVDKRISNLLEGIQQYLNTQEYESANSMVNILLTFLSVDVGYKKEINITLVERALLVAVAVAEKFYSVKRYKNLHELVDKLSSYLDSNFQVNSQIKENILKWKSFIASADFIKLAATEIFDAPITSPYPVLLQPSTSSSFSSKPAPVSERVGIAVYGSKLNNFGFGFKGYTGELFYHNGEIHNITVKNQKKFADESDESNEILVTVTMPYLSENKDHPYYDDKSSLASSQIIFIVFDVTNRSSFAEAEQNLNRMQTFISENLGHHNPAYYLVGVDYGRNYMPTYDEALQELENANADIFDHAYRDKKAPRVIFTDEIKQVAESHGARFAEIVTNGSNEEEFITEVVNAEINRRRQKQNHQNARMSQPINVQKPATFFSWLSALFWWLLSYIEFSSDYILQAIWSAPISQPAAQPSQSLQSNDNAGNNFTVNLPSTPPNMQLGLASDKEE
jgi:hypothetical protein